MFSTSFNNYLRKYKCSAKKISAMTHISEPTISRYKTGKTIPAIDSGNIERITQALVEISNGELIEEEVFEDLMVSAYEDLELVDYTVFSEKLTLLIETLSINKSKLADAIPISPSYLSKICTGQAKPRGPVYIADRVAVYISEKVNDIKQIKRLQNLIWQDNIKDGVITTSDECYRYVKKWLLTGESKSSTLADSRLHQFNEYELLSFLSYKKPSTPPHIFLTIPIQSKIVNYLYIQEKMGCWMPSLHGLILRMVQS